MAIDVEVPKDIRYIAVSISRNDEHRVKSSEAGFREK